MQVEFTRKTTYVAFHVDPETLREIDALVTSGRYESRSELVRKAIQELIERVKSGGLVIGNVMDIIYRDLLRSQDDGALIFDASLVKSILNERGLKYDAHSLGRLVNRFKAYLVRRGWQYVGSYPIRGSKYHVFVRGSLPPRARDLIREYEVREKVLRHRRNYRHLAVEVVEYVLRNPGRFIVNPSGLYKLSTRDIIEVARELGIDGVRVSAWLVNKVISELSGRGFTAWRERRSRYTYIYFRRGA